MANLKIKDGVVISLHIGYWQGRKALKASDLGLVEAEVPDIYQLGQKMLIPIEERNAFRAIETRARLKLENYSFKFFVGSAARFVPIKSLGRVLDELKGHEAEFNEAVDDILSRYDQIRREMLEKYSDLRDKLEPFYPSPQALRRKYYFRWSTFQVTTPNGEEAVPEALAEEYAQFRDSLRKEMEGFLDDAVADLRGQVVEKVEPLLKRIESGEIIRDQTLQSIRGVCDKFEMLNFAGDKTVEQALARLRGAINGSKGEDMKASDLKDKIGKAAEAVLQAATTDSDISKVTGRYKRAIWMNDQEG